MLLLVKVMLWELGVWCESGFGVCGMNESQFGVKYIGFDVLFWCSFFFSR